MKIKCPKCKGTYPKFKDGDSGIDLDKGRADYQFVCECGYECEFEFILDKVYICCECGAIYEEEEACGCGSENLILESKSEVVSGFLENYQKEFNEYLQNRALQKKKK